MTSMLDCGFVALVGAGKEETRWSNSLEITQSGKNTDKVRHLFKD